MKKLLKYSNIRAAQENRLPILGLDVDGTLLEHTHPPDFGNPIPGMIEELEKLRKAGWIISIWTCRGDVEKLRAHLDMHNIPYDYINESPLKYPDDSVKIQADVYLDDKAMHFDGSTENLADKILHFKPWHK